MTKQLNQLVYNLILAVVNHHGNDGGEDLEAKVTEIFFNTSALLITIMIKPMTQGK